LSKIKGDEKQPKQMTAENWTLFGVKKSEATNWYYSAYFNFKDQWIIG
jgi:hypothetical protein